MKSLTVILLGEELSIMWQTTSLISILGPVGYAVRRKQYTQTPVPIVSVLTVGQAILRGSWRKVSSFPFVKKTAVLTG
jgi:hypothetical protein